MSHIDLTTYAIGSGLLLLGLFVFTQKKQAIPVKKKAVRHVNNNR